MKYKIYCLKNPINNNIRYVGITTKTLSNRLTNHIYDAKKKDRHVCNWINSLLLINTKPIIEQIEECDEANWQEREKYWIKFYSKLFNLTNSHEGGTGVNLIKRKNTSKFKEIYQCDMDYNIIKLWNSIQEASQILMISKHSIYKCVQQIYNSNPTAGKYKWVYKDNYDNNNYIIKNNKPKKDRILNINIIETDLQNNTKIYSCISDCARKININDHILRRKLVKGKWFFNNRWYEIYQKDIV